MSNFLDLIMMQLPLLLAISALIPGGYLSFFSKQQNDERGNKIITVSFRYTYLFVMTGILCLFLCQRLFQLSFEEFKNYLFVLVVLANCCLGSSVFVLNRKY